MLQLYQLVCCCLGVLLLGVLLLGVLLLSFHYPAAALFAGVSGAPIFVLLAVVCLQGS